MIRYTWLHPVFSQSMTSNHQLMTREMSSSSNKSSTMPYYCKEIPSIQVQTTLKSLRLYRHPLPFKCIITPRTPTAETLVRDSVNKDYWEDHASSIDLRKLPSNSNNDLKRHVPIYKWNYFKCRRNKAATSNLHISTTNSPNTMVLYTLELSHLTTLHPTFLMAKNMYC